MIFTRATGYALLALIELSKTKQPIDSKTLAENIGISKYFLAKLLQNLSKVDIVVSFKGTNGGFKLNHSPKEINIIDVFRCVEDKNFLVYECAKNQDNCPSNKANICALWPFLNMVEENMIEYLSQFTLEDIIHTKV
ncbi:MAG: Rrf2 family transcriptional regulator [Epsilonproteobacteria bacterium]|nr:Rrf2 family transcriptional regulator [Campylobacterota bacterium]